MNHDIIPVRVCVFDDISITSYPIKSNYNAHEAYPDFGNFYLASIINEKKKIIAACVFISSIKDSKSRELAAIAKEIFEKNIHTKEQHKQAKNLLVSRVNINYTNGTIVDAFSQKELDRIFTEFYMNYST
ncbi:negative control protein of sporulation, partial [Escherichia coli]|nr:negative control protein of sporulation [Escherichia coli]